MDKYYMYFTFYSCKNDKFSRNEPQYPIGFLFDQFTENFTQMSPDKQDPVQFTPRIALRKCLEKPFSRPVN